MSNYKNPTRAMSFPEAEVQAVIVQYLQLMKIYCLHIPNERKSTAVAMGRLVAQGLRKGAADLLIFYPNDWKKRIEIYHQMALGTPISNRPLVTMGYIEVKRPKGGVQSDAQKRFERRCNAVGISYDLARSVDEVKVILEKRYNITL